MIEAHGLVKRYGSTMAVNDLSFSSHLMSEMAPTADHLLVI